jgi:fatty-acyl-CoA synthase
VPELQYMLRHSEAAAVVSAEDFGGVDYLELFEGFLTSLPELQYLLTVGEADLWYDDRIYQFEDLVSSGEGRPFEAAEVSPDDTFAILYTSGTMGKPKGVALTHASMLETAAATVDAIGCPPTTWSSASPRSSTCSVSAPGSWARWPPARRWSCRSSSTRRGALAHRGAPGHGPLRRAHGVHHGAAGAGGAAYDLSSLRTGIVAGAPVGDDLVRRIRASSVRACAWPTPSRKRPRRWP